MEAKPTRGCTRERALGVRERHPDGESSADLRGRESLTAAWGLRPGRPSVWPGSSQGHSEQKAWLLLRRSVATAWETLAIQMSMAPSRPRAGFL